MNWIVRAARPVEDTLGGGLGDIQTHAMKGCVVNAKTPIEALTKAGEIMPTSGAINVDIIGVPVHVEPSLMNRVLEPQEACKLMICVLRAK